MLSIILPSYNEEKCIKRAYDTIQSLLTENKIEGYHKVYVDGIDDCRELFESLEKNQKEMKRLLPAEDILFLSARGCAWVL